jgi:hypothetical protein
VGLCTQKRIHIDIIHGDRPAFGTFGRNQLTAGEYHNGIYMVTVDNETGDPDGIVQVADTGMFILEGLLHRFHRTLETDV